MGYLDEQGFMYPVTRSLTAPRVGGMHPIAFGIIGIVATVPVAALSWTLIEKRAMSLKSRLKQQAIRREKASVISESRREA